MGLFSWMRRKPEAAATPAPSPRASIDGPGRTFASLNDPDLLEWIRSGDDSGGAVSVKEALRNTAVMRSVELISMAIGMLPLRIVREGAREEEARDHPLWSVLMHRPNPWQTPHEFKQVMQTRGLVIGNAYARIVRLGGRPVSLIPLRPGRMQVEEADDLTPIYRWTPRAGGSVVLPPEDVLHLRGLSLDGVKGLSKVELAADALQLAREAETAAKQNFLNGMQVGGWLSHPGKLSDTARENIVKSLEARLAGSRNAGRWGLLEEGVKAEQNRGSAVDSQNLETRSMQIEEISRVFGVPRPLLNMNETSWGSGIEQLALLFVRFSLAPWFSIWENAIARVLLTPGEVQQGYRADFDERELLRGSMKDQAEFFAKALGSGGHRAWMRPNEVREITGLPPDPDGDRLEQGNQGTISVASSGGQGGVA